ncbi:MAG TPA: hypothetical protein VK797_12105 [Tepidisphaeraceae bacterium]|jgi:hypothetical protein|nr:hypothetical protein [Tepidisphaeraceae bacterium]
MSQWNEPRLLLIGLAIFIGCVAVASQVNGPATSPPRPPFRNQIVVSPDDPGEEGDFGPHTPGTQTSGLQEALDAAKARGLDVYIAGGSWTSDKTKPIVYNLNTTLRVPWMQNFRLDSGNCVLNYTPSTGDAVVFDSQMSCCYRFGLIVTRGDGAAVRLRPVTAGPDRFKVITSTEFVFNALVCGGGGGAWPGGKPYDSHLDPKRHFTGTGLDLDATAGSIDANKITVIETVGCATGLEITGAATRNTIEEVNIHLCRNGVRVGNPGDGQPADNRIEAFVDSQGIEPSSAVDVFGSRNLLTLSVRRLPNHAGPDLVFDGPAADNLAIVHFPCIVLDHSSMKANRVIRPDAGASTIRGTTKADR